MLGISGRTAHSERGRNRNGGLHPEGRGVRDGFRAEHSAILVGSSNNGSEKMRGMSKNIDLSLKNKRGFMSRTLNTFQIGIISNKGEWMGEESFMPKSLPYEYSIVAKTRVVALEIRRSEFLNQLNTKEFMMKFKKSVAERKAWINQRFKECSLRSTEVLQMNKSSHKYEENLTEYSKKFPQATNNALTNFRRNYFKDLDPHSQTFSNNPNPAPLLSHQTVIF